MPKFLEAELKKEYGANSDIPFKVMNAMGAMRGSKETPKGAAMEAKHADKLTRHLVGRRGVKGGVPVYMRRGEKYGKVS